MTTLTTTPAPNAALAFFGRLLIAALFIPAGIGKLTGFAGTVGYITSKGLPLPEVGAVIAIVVELGVGLAFLLGWHTKLAALVLAAFTLAATVFFHNFWALPAEQVMVQQLMFMKNIAVTGGLLFVAAWGAGAWSLDARK